MCAYISCELLKYIYKDIKTLKYIKDIKKTIDINLLGKKFTCEALIDSGNLLKDPLGNNEVIIVKSKILSFVAAGILLVSIVCTIILINYAIISVFTITILALTMLSMILFVISAFKKFKK